MSAGKGAASAAPEYPRVLAATRAVEADQWMIADALLLEIGPPAEDGWNDGSVARFEECARYLTERGLEYEPDSLRRFRDTAVSFTAGTRVPAVSFTAHRVAGSPEMLAEAIRRNDGKPPTRRFVERVRREIREAEERAEALKRERERKRAAEKAERERQKAEAERRRASEDEAARRRIARAEERAQQAQAEAERIWGEQQRLAEQKAERERKEAERKAAQVAQALEDKRVAEALVSSKSLGSRRIANAVHENEAERRRKVQQRNEQIAADGALPLPAYVPEMIRKIEEWSSALAALTDQVEELPPEDPRVQTLRAVVEDHLHQTERWMRALDRPNAAGASHLEVIEGVVA